MNRLPNRPESSRCALGVELTAATVGSIRESEQGKKKKKKKIGKCWRVAGLRVRWAAMRAQDIKQEQNVISNRS